MRYKNADETNFLKKKVMNKEITFPRKVKSKSIHLLSNRKADERVLSIYLFIIYIIVGIGIVSGVILFYGSPLDVREREAGVLTDAVIDCLVDGGQLKKNHLDNPNSLNLKEFCKFDFRDNTKKYNGEERYAVKVELYDFDTGELKGALPVAGNKGFLEFCDAEGKDIPKCNKKEVYVLYGPAKFILKINSAVNKVQNIGE